MQHVKPHFKHGSALAKCSCMLIGSERKLIKATLGMQRVHFTRSLRSEVFFLPLVDRTSENKSRTHVYAVTAGDMSSAKMFS